jgi:hypothetical protein
MLDYYLDELMLVLDAYADMHKIEKEDKPVEKFADEF